MAPNRFLARTFPPPRQRSPKNTFPYFAAPHSSLATIYCKSKTAIRRTVRENLRKPYLVRPPKRIIPGRFYPFARGTVRRSRFRAVHANYGVNQYAGFDPARLSGCAKKYRTCSRSSFYSLVSESLRIPSRVYHARLVLSAFSKRVHVARVTVLFCVVWYDGPVGFLWGAPLSFPESVRANGVVARTLVYSRVIDYDFETEKNSTYVRRRRVSSTYFPAVTSPGKNARGRRIMTAVFHRLYRRPFWFRHYAQARRSDRPNKRTPPPQNPDYGSSGNSKHSPLSVREVTRFLENKYIRRNSRRLYLSSLHASTVPGSR